MLLYILQLSLVCSVQYQLIPSFKYILGRKNTTFKLYKYHEIKMVNSVFFMEYYSY